MRNGKRIADSTGAKVAAWILSAFSKLHGGDTGEQAEYIGTVCRLAIERNSKA